MQKLTPYTSQDLTCDLSPFQLEGVLRIGVACSGGADSLALTLLLNNWAKTHGKEIIAFHVDHKLRPTSTWEATHLSEWLKTHNVTHEVLTWNHSGVKTRIQERAREARYQLLNAAARKHSIQYMLLAHHLKDQEETFWMRLSKGSGTDGLSAMKPLAQKEGITYLRPLLNVSPERLRLYLNSIQQPWIQDPSNENPKYLRIRLRSLLEEEGYSLDKTLSKLQEDSDYIHSEVEKWMFENLIQNEDSIQVPYCKLKLLHTALGKRVLQKLIQKVSPSPYPKRNDALSQLWSKLQDPKFQRGTLGNCVIKKSQGHLTLTKEVRRAPKDNIITNTKTSSLLKK